MLPDHLFLLLFPLQLSHWYLLLFAFVNTLVVKFVRKEKYIYHLTSQSASPSSLKERKRRKERKFSSLPPRSVFFSPKLPNLIFLQPPPASTPCPPCALHNLCAAPAPTTHLSLSGKSALKPPPLPLTPSVPCSDPKPTPQHVGQARPEPRAGALCGVPGGPGAPSRGGGCCPPCWRRRATGTRRLREAERRGCDLVEGSVVQQSSEGPPPVPPRAGPYKGHGSAAGEAAPGACCHWESGSCGGTRRRVAAAGGGPASLRAVGRGGRRRRGKRGCSPPAECPSARRREREGGHSSFPAPGSASSPPSPCSSFAPAAPARLRERRLPSTRGRSPARTREGGAACGERAG